MFNYIKIKLTATWCLKPNKTVAELKFLLQ